jgi:glycosyltransferase involved in cell wall biosynthesis/peptidoglycan/xylan/chitin deacetylase (PgdA/CDA1 family)
LTRQELAEEYEVIVVVDGSTDGSADALRSLELDIPLTVIEQENAGVSAARNSGAEIARGEFLLFLDDDMVAGPDLLDQHDRAQSEKAALVLGHVPIHPDSPRNFLSDAVGAWAKDRLERLSQSDISEQMQDWVMGQSSISRSLFFELGRFDDTFTREGSYGNEDLEFCYRVRQAGVPIVFNANAISRQVYVVSPRTHLQQWFESGSADVQFVRKHPELAEQVFPRSLDRRWITSFFDKPLRGLSLVAVKSFGDNKFAQRLFFFVRARCYAEGVEAAGGVPQRQPLQILCYHAIEDLSGTVSKPYGIPPDHFRAQIRVLQKNGYQFISGGEFVRFLNGESGLPKRALLLTFDDCYQSLSDAALPILADLGVPAVAFAVSEKIGASNDWDDHLGAPKLALADAASLRELERSRIAVASHSRSHPNLTTLSAEELGSEVNQSLGELRSKELRPIALFAYPYGEHDQRVRNAVQVAGFEVAMTTESGIVGLDSNRYRLSRYEIMAGESMLRLQFRLFRDRLSFLAAGRLKRKIHSSPVVTIVIPAYNAAGTLAATLASVRAQTFTGWEAVVIDDGSTDATGKIAGAWCRNDPRIRLIQRENGGEAAARNAGIEAATSDWLIFLDSDDWIAPEYVERMLDKAAENDRLDGIVCGCVRVTPTGVLTAQAVYHPKDLADPFPEFVHDCPLAIHNCMIKRAVALEIGGFDETLRTCADWDFWQRVARIGARLGMIPEVLAMYRIRSGSSSTNAASVLADGHRVIRRGYKKDPRVPEAIPAKYSNGLDSDDLGETLFRHTLWPASMQMVRGESANSLLETLASVRAPGLNPERVGEELYHGIPLAAGETPDIWPERFASLENELTYFLRELELTSGATGLAETASRHLELRVVECADFDTCLVVGASYGTRIDVTQSIKDINPDFGTRQVVLVVMAGENRIGTVAIPTLSASLQASTIAEAVVEQLAWQIMRHHVGLDFPPESPPSIQFHRLVQEARVIPTISKLFGFGYSLIKWQKKNGALKNRAVLRDMIGFLTQLKLPSLGWRLWKAAPAARHTILAETLTRASKERVHKQFEALTIRS